MGRIGKLDFGRIQRTLDDMTFALSLSDFDAPDVPLIYVNDAFTHLTGYSPTDCIGRNCRFLQGDIDNQQARAELRLAITERRRAQVLLQNKRRDGRRFFNLLYIEPVGTYRNAPNMILGAQFDLGSDVVPPELDIHGGDENSPQKTAAQVAVALQLERRRVAISSALRLIQSWCVMADLRDRPHPL